MKIIGTFESKLPAGFRRKNNGGFVDQGPSQLPRAVVPAPESSLGLCCNLWRKSQRNPKVPTLVPSAFSFLFPLNKGRDYIHFFPKR